MGPYGIIFNIRGRDDRSSHTIPVAAINLLISVQNLSPELVLFSSLTPLQRINSSPTQQEKKGVLN